MRDDAGYRGVLRMRGLPFSTVVDEVLEFFGQSASLKRENVHLMRRSDGRASGDAYAVFDTEEAAVAALSFDKQKLGTRWLGPSPRPSPNPRPDPSPSPSPRPSPNTSLCPQCGCGGGVATARPLDRVRLDAEVFHLARARVMVRATARVRVRVRAS